MTKTVCTSEEKGEKEESRSIPKPQGMIHEGTRRSRGAGLKKEQIDEESSGAGPCSVVNASKTVSYNPHTSTHKGLWLRQWWQVRLQRDGG